MTERIGQQLGNYQLTRLLGKGGFAEVYLGEHIYLKTPAAIKLLQAHLGSPEDQETFRLEAQTVARLIHPHIVRVLDYNVDGTTPYLVMDYAPNGTLRQRHPKGSRLPITTIVDYVKQIAAGLQYAHDEKLVHRDIKPENMLVGRKNEILLSDFGIALVAQSSRNQSTQDVVGTVVYMSPEQIQGKPRLASDQYSLAVVVYEWLSGTLPFQGSFTELCTQHMFATPPPLHEKLPGISPDIERVVTIALSKDPKQRFGSIQAFANALEQASQAQSSPDVTPQINPTILASGELPGTSETPAKIAPTQMATPSSGAIHISSPANSGSPGSATPATSSSDPMRNTPSPRTTDANRRNSAPINSGSYASNQHSTYPGYTTNPPAYYPPVPQQQSYQYPYGAYPPQQYQYYAPYQQNPLQAKEHKIWSFGRKQFWIIIIGTILLNIIGHYSFSVASPSVTIVPYFLLFLYLCSAYGPWVGLGVGVLENLIDVVVHYPSFILENGHWSSYPTGYAPWSYIPLYGLAGLLIGLTGFYVFYWQAHLGKALAAFLGDLLGALFLFIIAIVAFFIDNPSILTSGESNYIRSTLQFYLSFYGWNIAFCAIMLFFILLIHSAFLRSVRPPATLPPYSLPPRYS